MTGDDAHNRTWWPRLAPSIAVLLAGVVHGTLQATRSGLAEFDAYFHVGLSQLYQQHGLTRAFPWMSASVLRDGFNDRDLLLHLLGWAGLSAGMPPPLVASVLPTLSAAVLAGAMCWFLQRRNVAYPLAWTAWWLTGSAYVLVRMSFVKSTTLFLALVLVFVDALLTRRRRVAIFTAWLTVLTYQGYPLLVVIAVLHGIVAWRRERDPHAWRGMRAALVGTAAGLIINPFFPYDIDAAYYEYVVQFVTMPGTASVGGEWVPLEPLRFLVATIATLVPLALALRKGKDVDATALFLLVLSGVLLVGAISSARGIEYFVTVATVAAAVTWRPTHVPKVAGVMVALLGTAWGALNWDDARRIGNEVAEAARPDEFRAGAEWLALHSDDGEVVAASWDDMPMLFYFNRHNRYLYGLNPAYGCGYSWDLCRAMELVYAGRVRDPESFMDRAGSKFLVIGRSDAYAGRTSLVLQLEVNPLFEHVFQSGGLHIFMLRGAPQR